MYDARGGSRGVVWAALFWCLLKFLKNDVNADSTYQIILDIFLTLIPHLKSVFVYMLHILPYVIHLTLVSKSREVQRTLN